MRSQLPRVLVFSGLLVALVGCTFPSSGTVYDRRNAGRSMSVDTGDVVSVRDVQISGRRTVVGYGGGGLMGGAAASGGSGVGGAVAQAGGVIVGAIAGEAVEEAATRRTAQEVTIKMANGQTIAVVQEIGTDGRINAGERVQVLEGGGGTVLRRLL
ncbi:MAG TPA: hypothetical protein VGE76_12975 [Opitutaceae bacterium]